MSPWETQLESDKGRDPSLSDGILLASLQIRLLATSGFLPPSEVLGIASQLRQVRLIQPGESGAEIMRQSSSNQFAGIYRLREVVRNRSQQLRQGDTEGSSKFTQNRAGWLLEAALDLTEKGDGEPRAFAERTQRPAAFGTKPVECPADRLPVRCSRR